MQMVRHLAFFSFALMPPVEVGSPWIVRCPQLADAVISYLTHYVRQWQWPQKVTDGTDALGPSLPRLAVDSVFILRMFTERENLGHLATNESMDSDMAVAIAWVDL